MGLKIAPTLELPIDAVTSTFGVLATRGAGKSNAAVVMAEEMYDAGVPWIAIDPKGDWAGIRSSEDGTGPGLPVVVFGGRHGDVPLEPTAGQLLASLVLEQRLSCVLDVSQFSKAETVRFLLAFGAHLFKHADDDGAEPLHLFLEEAHEYLPQQVTGDIAQLVNVWQRIVKQGRFKGLGCTMISQRSSSLNKDVLELVDTLVVLRTTGPRSRAAVAAWVKDQDVDPGLMASLPTLGNGEAWVWSPGEFKIMERVQFRRRRTFDSGATPKVGEARRAPATLADVDLAAIKEQMADTIERVKADDPKALRAEITRLRKELGARPTETVEREVVVTVDRFLLAGEEVLSTMRDLIAKVDEALATAGAQAPFVVAPPPAAPTRSAWAERAERALPVSRPSRTAANPEDVQLKAGARRIVETLARHHPMRVTKAQLGTLAKFKVSGGTFQTYWGALKRAGLVEEGNGEVWATDAGLAYVGTEVGEPMSTEEVLVQWRNVLKAGARAMLDVVVASHPVEVSREELAERVGMTASGGTFQTYLGTLRRNGLVEVDQGQVSAGSALFLGGM